MADPVTNKFVYVPSPVPTKVEDIPEYLRREFERIAEAFNGVAAIELPEYNAAPERPRRGMIILVDGVNFNPGAGQGVYARYNDTWNKL